MSTTLRRPALAWRTRNPCSAAKSAIAARSLRSAPWRAANSRRLRKCRSRSGWCPSSWGSGSGARGRTSTVTSIGSSAATAPTRRAPGSGLRALPPTFVLAVVAAGLLLAVLFEPVFFESVFFESVFLKPVFFESVLLGAVAAVRFLGHSCLLSAAFRESNRRREPLQAAQRTPQR